jgi:hypothetical protein
MRLRTKFTALAVGALLAVGAPAAMAQSPSEEGYSAPGGVVQTQLDNGGGNPAAKNSESAPLASERSAPAGKLPFTGLDVALVVGAGGMLMLLGFGVRRLSRSATVA